MSSIMKGIVDEGEEVAVIYIDGKPSAKYAKKHEAERDAEFMRSRHPNKKIEIKHEVHETEAKKGADGKRCWKGKRYAGTENGKDKCIPVKNEAANPAQQAAIAISKKKKGEKPKNVSEASGTPGGVEMFRTKDMVNTTMQQNLYRRELQAVKDAEKKRKQAEYRKNNPRESIPTIHVGASVYPIPVIQAWADNNDAGEAVKYAVNKFANKQTPEFKNDLMSDDSFKKAVINFFNVAANSLASRKEAMAARGGKIPDSDYRTKEQTAAGYDAVNKINDVLLTYMKKYGVDKTGRRVPPGFNYTLGEGVIVGHDANDPEVAILGGAGTMSLSRLKKKAQGEAEQLANDLARGRFKAAAYNIKQLENTLKTIVAAEDEMEKLYFGESIEELNEGWKMGTLGTIAGIVFGPSVAASMFGDIGDHNGVNHLLTVLGSMAAGGYFGKDISSVRDLIDRFTKNPVEFRKMIKQRNAEKKKNKRASEKSSAISVLKGVISQIDLVIQAINNKQYKKAANIFSSGDLNPGMLGLFPNLVYALENLSDMEETTLVISEIRYALDVYEKFKTSPNDYAPEFIQALGEFKQYLMNRIREDQIDEDYTGEYAAEKTSEINPYGGLKDTQHRGAISETPTDNPTGTSTEGGWRRTDMEEDTAYASGMGQGGNAGESYRKFKPKSAGTYKESSIMKGLKR